jgi:hypothetical protein
MKFPIPFELVGARAVLVTFLDLVASVHAKVNVTPMPDGLVEHGTLTSAYQRII